MAAWRTIYSSVLEIRTHAFRDNGAQPICISPNLRVYRFAKAGIVKLYCRLLILFRKASKTLNILNRLASDVRLMFRRPVRMQCAALCYRFRKKSATPEMLVITSRDTGRWVIPKGWPMEGKMCHEAAAREAYEEAGVKGDASPDRIGFYMYDKGLNSGLKVECMVQVYPMVVLDIAKNFPEKGSRKSEWVSFEEASKRVAEPMLRDLILDFEQRLLSTMHPAPQTVTR